MKTTVELVELLHRRKISFALYRLPGREKLQLLVQYSSFPQRIATLDSLPDRPGFLIAPFPVNAGEGSYLLQPDLMGTPEEVLAMAGPDLEDCELFSDYPRAVCNHRSVTRAEYLQQVSEAVQAIRDSCFYKVIVSRQKVVSRPLDLQPLEFFTSLCESYPHAFVYYWQLPGVGNWMGATPEILIKESAGRIHTLSLAGTQLYEQPDLEEYGWKAKEIAEQAIVSRFIVQLLDKMGVEGMDVVGPMTLRAGNLVHLGTGFNFDSDNLRVSRGRFIQQLHPTPAVAGLPREPALHFIRSTEGYNRSYYSGLVGPVQLKGETHLYVNLRCMQLYDNELVLYSGAGITGSSNPEKEWVETENKMKTLLNVIES